MLCDTLTNECIITVSTIAIAGSTAIALIVSLFLNKRLLQKQKEQLIVANYEIIINRIDSDLAKASRYVIYNTHNLMKGLIEKYENRNQNDELFSLNEIAKFTAGIYEAIGFLLKQNKELKNMIVNQHGFTIGRLWKILQPLHETWKGKDHVLDYTEFKNLGMLCAGKPSFKKKIEEFYTENYLKNTHPPNRSTLVFLSRKILGYEPTEP